MSAARLTEDAVGAWWTLGMCVFCPHIQNDIEVTHEKRVTCSVGLGSANHLLSAEGRATVSLLLTTAVKVSRTLLGECSSRVEVCVCVCTQQAEGEALPPPSLLLPLWSLSLRCIHATFTHVASSVSQRLVTCH